MNHQDAERLPAAPLSAQAVQTGLVEPPPAAENRPKGVRPAESPPELVPPPAPALRRALKVVLTFQPAGEHGVRAVVALGTDGCDPILHCLDVPVLPDALARLPELIAAAEARWQAHPRYPLARPPTRPSSRPQAEPLSGTDPLPLAAPGDTAEASPARSAPKAEPPSPAPRPVVGGQLSLFDEKGRP